MKGIRCRATARRHHRDRRDLPREHRRRRAADSLILEVTGTEDKIDAIIEMLLPYGIKELVRTGRIAMTRGGGTPMAVDGKKYEHHRYRSAGEGKAKVGSLI